ncbi:GNAT family N-acetyltransferase [Nocardioides fonticola]|uniref:GNAT family N-acetyltransferase n=1 Tax=Nocardioides fonticola TaxID=450363 RepID=A0ABP7XDS7_9ACTN
MTAPIDGTTTGPDVGGLVVRRVREAEHAAVGAITVAAYADFTAGPEDPYLDRLRDTGRRDREAEVWVALDAAGALLGSVTLCPPGSSWREVAASDEGEFRMLAVDPGAQGGGAGRALVHHALARFRADGARSVVISSLPTMTTAHRLYAATGFARVPERDHSPMPGIALWAFEHVLRPTTADAISDLHAGLGD